MSWSGEGGEDKAGAVEADCGAWRLCPPFRVLLAEHLSWCSLVATCQADDFTERISPFGSTLSSVSLCNSARKLRQEELLAAKLGPEAKPCFEPGRASSCPGQGLRRGPLLSARCAPAWPPWGAEVEGCVTAHASQQGLPKPQAQIRAQSEPVLPAGLGLARRRGSRWPGPGPAISSPALPFPISPFEIYPPYQGARAGGGCRAFVPSCARWPSARPALQRPRGRVWPWDTEGPLLSHRPMHVLCPGAPPPCPHPTPLH